MIDVCNKYSSKICHDIWFVFHSFQSNLTPCHKLRQPFHNCVLYYSHNNIDTKETSDEGPLCCVVMIPWWHNSISENHTPLKIRTLFSIYQAYKFPEEIYYDSRDTFVCICACLSYFVMTEPKKESILIIVFVPYMGYIHTVNLVLTWRLWGYCCTSHNQGLQQNQCMKFTIFNRSFPQLYVW